MKRKAEPVLNCTKTEPAKINKLAIKVQKGMTDNAATFPGTTAEVTQLGTDQAALAALIGLAKGNHTFIDQRNEKAVVVFEELKDLLTPVSKAAAGSKAIIDLSGFPISQDPSPQAIPEQVVIKRIVDGPEALSAKIFIESLKQNRLTYTVRMTTVAGAPDNDPSWKVVLQTTNSRELVIPNLVHNQDVYFSVNASNARGKGIFSKAMLFTA